MVIATLVSRAIAGRIPSCEIAGEHTFEDLDIDNLDRICIANEVEEHFHVELSDDAVAAWDSVADVMLSVEQARA